MPKIIDYMVVCEDCNITARVKHYLSLGWQPFGSMSVESSYKYQPMVKYEEDEIPNPNIKAPE